MKVPTPQRQQRRKGRVLLAATEIGPWYCDRRHRWQYFLIPHDTRYDFVCLHGDITPPGKKH